MPHNQKGQTRLSYLRRNRQYPPQWSWTEGLWVLRLHHLWLVTHPADFVVSPVHRYRALQKLQGIQAQNKFSITAFRRWHSSRQLFPLGKTSRFLSHPILSGPAMVPFTTEGTMLFLSSPVSFGFMVVWLICCSVPHPALLCTSPLCYSSGFYSLDHEFSSVVTSVISNPPFT